MVLAMKPAYRPRYDYHTLQRVKRYFAKHTGASTYAASKALHLQWRTVKRYRKKLAV